MFSGISSVVSLHTHTLTNTFMEVTPDILSYGKISQDQIAGFPCRVFEGTRQLIIIARKYSKTELAAYYRFSRNKCKTEATFEVESAAHSGIFMTSIFH